MSNKKYSVAPVRVKNISKQAKEVFSSLQYLKNRQNSDGSWGQGNIMDRLVSTCHTTMVFLASGYSADEAFLKKACDWLSSSKVSKHNNAYWRLGPLAGIPGYEEIVEKDLNSLCNVFKKGASPHPNQRVELFVFKVIKKLGLCNEQLEEEILSRTLGDWNEQEGWNNRADTTTNCWNLLSEFDFPKKKEIKEQTIALLKTWGNERSHNHIEWQSLVSTSYTVMNLIESELIDDSEVVKLIDGAVDWLRSQKVDDSWGVEQPPFGGAGDITSKDYFSAAILRGIVAYYCFKNSSFVEEIQAERSMVSERKTAWYKRILIFSYSFFSLFILFENRALFLKIIKNTNTETLTLIASWTAILTFIYGVFSLLRSFIKKI